MGSHGVASARLRAGKTSQHAGDSAASQLRSLRGRTLRDWPVSWRLVAVIVLALIMGLVFGGLRVASAADSAAQFGRVSQLASLGQQVTGLVQALQDERDETTGVSSGGNPGTLKPWYHATDAAAGRVRALAAGVGGSFPANIQASVTTVLSEINDLGELRKTAQASQDALAVIANYAAPIGDMITLNDLIAQGISDPSLVNDVRTLNSLSLAKDEAAQQRALFFHTFTDQFFGDGEQQALTTALSEELNDTASFEATATPAEQKFFTTIVAGQGVNLAEGIEDFVLTDGNPLDVTQIDGITLNDAPARWYSAMSDKIDKVQAVEQQVARNIVARSQVLRRGAEESALFNGILTAVILFLVLIATLAVARSLVRPLRRLREGALNIATVQLPERVRQLGEDTDPAVSLDVAPIDVLSADEIGQVARAFDQVHAEAVRLAGNEAMLRSSFNAMFVNLSRRSQSLIERLARMIDSLEQNEADPDRLSNLFSMDHLVTRMRRDVRDRAVQQGGDENPAGDLGHRAGRIRRRAPAGRDRRERHDLLLQGHPGAHLGPGNTQRGCADRGQRQRGRRPRGPADGDEPAAGQPAGHRRLGLPAHGAVRGGPAGRAARGPGPAPDQVPTRTDRPGVAAGQRHRARKRHAGMVRKPSGPANGRRGPHLRRSRHRRALRSGRPAHGRAYRQRLAGRRRTRAARAARAGPADYDADAHQADCAGRAGGTSHAGRGGSGSGRAARARAGRRLGGVGLVPQPAVPRVR
jgi:HAMP domain-containing protein